MLHCYVGRNDQYEKQLPLCTSEPGGWGLLIADRKAGFFMPTYLTRTRLSFDTLLPPELYHQQPSATIVPKNAAEERIHENPATREIYSSRSCFPQRKQDIGKLRPTLSSFLFSERRSQVTLSALRLYRVTELGKRG
jgi:hypothetical protein